jgi:hypothetical protein
MTTGMRREGDRVERVIQQHITSFHEEIKKIP